METTSFVLIWGKLCPSRSRMHRWEARQSLGSQALLHLSPGSRISVGSQLWGGRKENSVIIFSNSFSWRIISTWSRTLHGCLVAVYVCDVCSLLALFSILVAHWSWGPLTVCGKYRNECHHAPSPWPPPQIGFMSFGKVCGSFFCIFIRKSGRESGSPQKSFGTILGSMLPTVVLGLGQRTREPTNTTFLTQFPLPWKLFSQCPRAEGFVFGPRQWWKLVRGG